MDLGLGASKLATLQRLVVLVAGRVMDLGLGASELPTLQ
jgi:hypothetical protein